jgi:hypothetical protein
LDVLGLPKSTGIAVYKRLGERELSLAAAILSQNMRHGRIISNSADSSGF